MPASRPLKKPFIAILVKRAVLFFFLLSLLVVYLYGIGTAQEFMDRTQLLLLRLSVILGLSLAVSSIYGIILNVWIIVHDRKYRLLGGAGLYIALGIFGAVIATLAAFIIVAAGGNRT
ncbi:hypothetical protein [Treponema primitia]|uniref:hypothetical protein n=1 Tax=Treponema primitia TaxID=88058 RepID=UPI00025556B7|nr:hypothetical protein [Treponema primitia]